MLVCNCAWVLTSVVSYPDRGKDGNARYPGNFPGGLVEDLITHFNPGQVLEVFAGGGTGFDVARRMGYADSVHLDLNNRFGNFNLLADEVPEGSDFILAHPPYHDMIKYSGSAWGKGQAPHPDDLSNCATYDEFIHKLDRITASLFSSLRSGGRLIYLVGEVRKTGDPELHSIFRDMMKLGRLEAHIVKLQHNTTSGRRSYGNRPGESLDQMIAAGSQRRLSFVPIVHEDVVVMQRKTLLIIPVAYAVKEQRNFLDSPAPTWRDLVQTVLQAAGGQAHLSHLYGALEESHKAKNNPKHWRDAIRRTVNSDRRNFVSIDGRGTWALKPLPGRQRVASPEISL